MSGTRFPRTATKIALALAAVALVGGCSPSDSPGGGSTTVAPVAGSDDRWVPAVGASWQWQLTDPIDTSVEADVFNVDLFDVDAATIDQLHANGSRVICYMSAGSWEDWREDAGDFPDEALGNTNGWEGERWFDIRRLDVLGPAMEARMDLCKSKGFDGVEVDNIDGYANDTGFSLSAADQIAYNEFLADAAHERGLSIGLKNDLDQVGRFVDSYDFAINEECAEAGECDRLTPFIDAGKAVFHVEYAMDLDEFCPETTALGFSSIKKRLDLDAWIQTCP